MEQTVNAEVIAHEIVNLGTNKDAKKIIGIIPCKGRYKEKIVRYIKHCLKKIFSNGNIPLVHQGNMDLRPHINLGCLYLNPRESKIVGKNIQNVAYSLKLWHLRVGKNI